MRKAWIQFLSLLLLFVIVAPGAAGLGNPSEPGRRTHRRLVQQSEHPARKRRQGLGGQRCAVGPGGQPLFHHDP
jgi:hypothetical protein